MSNSRKRAVVLQGRDAAEMLQSIYLDGFCTGAASVLATVARHTPEAERDEFVQELANRFMEDPLMREALMKEIHERLAGVDSGPKEYRV